MPQTIALRAEAPQVDLASVMKAAQDYRTNELALRGAERAEQADLEQNNALQKYRFRESKGDPRAADELASYPELQKKLFDAFDGMSPAEFKESRKRANAFGEAARRVGMFAPGSPQRGAAWNSAIGDLHKAGYLSDEDANLAIEGGPNDLLIDQALTIEQYVEKYADVSGRKSGKKTGGTTKSGSKYDSGEFARLKDIETRLNKMREAGADPDAVDAEERRLRKLYDLPPMTEYESEAAQIGRAHV